jgi:hypothetical protein
MTDLPTIQFATELPPPAKAGGRSPGGNPFQKLMFDMPEPAADKKGNKKYAWFWVASEVPDTISDPAERAKEAKVNTQKLVNKFTSLSRRIRKHNSETHNYTMRKQQNEAGDWGLVVYRIPPGDSAAAS